MPAWTRDASLDRVRKLSNSNDVSLALKEIERSKNDLSDRPPSAADIVKRSSQRQKAERAARRLSLDGVVVDLPRFAYKPPSPAPPSARPPSDGRMSADQTPSPQLEIAALQAELARASARNHKLEAAVKLYRERRTEEKQAWENERASMARLVHHLKQEVEQGWSRCLRLHDHYENEIQQQRGPSSRRRRSSLSSPATATDATRRGAGRMYLSDEDVDVTYRRAPSTGAFRRCAAPSTSTSGEDSPYPSDYRLSTDDPSPPSSSCRRKGVRWSDHAFRSSSHTVNGATTCGSSTDEDDYFAPPRASELPDPYRSRSRTRQSSVIGRSNTTSSGVSRRPKAMRMSSYDA